MCMFKSKKIITPTTPFNFTINFKFVKAKILNVHKKVLKQF